MKNKGNIFGKLIYTIFFLFVINSSSAQQTAAKYSFVEADSIFNSVRIENAAYKLVMYNQNKDTISNLTVIDRQVTRETYNSVRCIKITEMNNQSKPATKTIAYIDINSLLPVHFETFLNDTLIQKADFDGIKALIIDYKNGKEAVSEIGLSKPVFLSNSFSELLQAIDFERNKIVRFETFSPGKSTNQFIVERDGETGFPIPGGEIIKCWLLKFRRLDSKGNESVAGYRYADKQTGKVLLYKSNIDTQIYFTYQLLFLK